MAAQSVQWQWDDTGHAPPLQSEFIDWLLTPLASRRPQTQEKWAEAHGVSPQTCGRWKRDPRFRKEWERRAAEMNLSIERVQTVIDTIFNAAAQGDMKAAETYMKYVERLLPPKRVLLDDDVSTMSDEELFALVEELRTGADAAG